MIPDLVDERFRRYARRDIVTADHPEVARYGLSSSTVVDMCPLVSYRMLNYWRANGNVTPQIVAPVGSGNHARWSLHDLHRVQVIDRLVNLYPYGQIPGALVRAIWDALENPEMAKRAWLVITPGPTVEAVNNWVPLGEEPAIVVPLRGT